MKIVISESQLTSIIKEHYDSDKLYSMESVVNRLKKGPREMRKYIKDLPSIPCTDGQGNETTCTKILEVLYVYLMGKY
jgi:hypothetical protein